MEKTYRIIPFDIEKAKAGAEVVTKKDELKVEIIKYDLKCNSPILAIINYKSGSQQAAVYNLDGTLYNRDLDLRIKEEVKQRRMTNQELSWWLRDCPEEHREYKFKTNPIVYHCYIYYNDDPNKPIDDRILIRSNGGEWREPIIEEE